MKAPIFLLIAGLLVHPAGVMAEPRGGIAMHGAPGEDADFSHFPYAEPNAPTYKKTVREIGQSVTSLAKFLGAKQIEWGNVPDGWAALKQVS